MGLPCPGKERDADMDSFSHDILKFELSGPEYENFSVVDLPGLFRSELFNAYLLMLIRDCRTYSRADQQRGHDSRSGDDCKISQ